MPRAKRPQPKWFRRVLMPKPEGWIDSPRTDEDYEFNQLLHQEAYIGHVRTSFPQPERAGRHCRRYCRLSENPDPPMAQLSCGVPKEVTPTTAGK